MKSDIRDGMSGLAVRSARRRMRRRTRVVILGLAVLTVGLFLLAMWLGSYRVSLPDILGVLRGAITADSDFKVHFAIYEKRLPRALLAVLVGLAFGISGSIFQTLVRNPLASPDIIGISAGASAGAVSALLVIGWTGAAVTLSAFVGAWVAAIIIYLFAWRRGMAGNRLVLVGVGVAALMEAFISYVITRADISDAQAALVWLTGSLTGSQLSASGQLSTILVVLIPAVALLAGPLRSLELGADFAAIHGAKVQSTQIGLVAVAVTLSAAATSVAGPVAFVAFVAGPLARALTRRPGLNLAASALAGAVVVLGADQVAQYLLPTTPLPVGVVTAAIGAPYLIWLLIRAGRRTVTG